MKKNKEYVVLVEERRCKRVRLQADSGEQALNIIERDYRRGYVDMNVGVVANGVYLAIDAPRNEMTDFQEIM